MTKTLRNKTLTITTITVLATFLMIIAIPASASDLCGTTIVTDLTLTHNLNCTGVTAGTTGLTIGADDIVVDLNGFTITDDPATSGSRGIDIVSHTDIVIKNGAIIGFEGGISADRVSDLTLENLSFFKQTCGGCHAVNVFDSDSVEITDSFFSMPPPSLSGSFVGSPEAIRLQSVDNFEVQRVHVVGGFIGVNYACLACDGTDLPSNGKVAQSTFDRTFIGVLVANSNDAVIENNRMADGVKSPCPFGFCPIDAKGISLGDFGSQITGVKILDNQIFGNDGLGIRAIGADNMEIKNNFIHSNTLDGILLRNGDDSNIEDNIVTNNVGGIRLESFSADPSTGNEIIENRAEGNTAPDLSHEGTSIGNLWEDNTCDTKSGAEIPAC